MRTTGLQWAMKLCNDTEKFAASSQDTIEAFVPTASYRACVTWVFTDMNVLFALKDQINEKDAATQT